MTWELYRWTWLLEGSLFVGFLPSSSLNRCRLYIPGRAMWGAITAESARAGADDQFPEYKEVGDKLRQQARFGYLFPAQQTEDGQWRAWLPNYVPKRGLCWRREDYRGENDPIPDRMFRKWLLTTRPGTAIEPQTGSALDSSLRETECVSQYWRRRDAPDDSTRVGYVGYFFATKGAKITSTIKQRKRLFVGGDTRYGLGALRRASQLEPEDTIFGFDISENGDGPIVKTDQVLAHSVAQESTEAEMNGRKEALRGRSRNNLHDFDNCLWMPGSRSKSRMEWLLRSDGTWIRSRDAD